MKYFYCKDTALQSFAIFKKEEEEGCIVEVARVYKDCKLAAHIVSLLNRESSLTAAPDCCLLRYRNIICESNRKS